MMRRWNHPHSLFAGVLIGLLLTYRPWIVFLLGIAAALLAVWLYRTGRNFGRNLSLLGRGHIRPRGHVAPEGYKWCANPTCRAPMPRTRRIYCSDACRRIVRLRLQAAAQDEQDEFADIPY